MSDSCHQYQVFFQRILLSAEFAKSLTFFIYLLNITYNKPVVHEADSYLSCMSLCCLLLSLGLQTRTGSNHLSVEEDRQGASGTGLDGTTSPIALNCGPQKFVFKGLCFYLSSTSMCLQKELANNPDCPHMCAYKLVSITFRWKLIGNQVERRIHQV